MASDPSNAARQAIRTWLSVVRAYHLCDAAMASKLAALDVRTAEHEVLANLVRDPRATLLVFPAAEPESYVEVRGSVTMTRVGGRELIDRLARQYDGVERFTGDDGTDRVRVVVRITPEKIVVRS